MQLSKVVKRFFLIIMITILVGIGVVSEVNPELFEDVAKTNPVGFFSVVQVSDGDTIVVDMNGVEERVRLIGIDTPEKDHPKKPVQCFALAASAFAKDLIADNPVRLEADPTNDNRDRYDRLLRYVYLPDGTHVNAEVVKQGYGFAYLSFPFTKLDEFKQSEIEAREQNLGLWNDCEIDPNDGRPQTNAAE